MTGHDHLCSLCSPWRGQKSSHASFPTSLQYVQYSVVCRAHPETYLQGQGNQINSNLWTKLISFIEIIINKYSFHSCFQSIVSGFLVDFPQDVRGCADAIVGARYKFCLLSCFPLKRKKVIHEQQSPVSVFRFLILHLSRVTKTEFLFVVSI